MAGGVLDLMAQRAALDWQLFLHVWPVWVVLAVLVFVFGRR
jgi:hypothetical protein